MWTLTAVGEEEGIKAAAKDQNILVMPNSEVIIVPVGTKIVTNKDVRPFLCAACFFDVIMLAHLLVEGRTT